MQQEDTETLHSNEMHQVDETIKGIKNLYQVEASRRVINKTYQVEASICKSRSCIKGRIFFILNCEYPLN